MQTEKDEDQRVRYSVSLVMQGEHRFYSLTMPSEVLSRTCFVSTRFEDPEKGFQRVLDKTRAKEIADYIDNGLGTIPNSIVLSAQPDAELKEIGGGKSIQFKGIQKAFLILDGQHRVYGFKLAKTSLRVPVVIYNGLSRKDESRLFIDINTKQRPVPNELLLDIKRLAEYEKDTEQQLRELFDMFNAEPSSLLRGFMSASERAKEKISRVTFNAALKPLMSIFSGSDKKEIFEAVNAYITAFITGMHELKVGSVITNPKVFRATMQLFPEIARRVKDRHGKDYSVMNFVEALSPIFEQVPPATIKRPANIKSLHAAFAKALKSDFKL